MKSLREPETNALRRHSLIEALHQIEGHAARLLALSHRAGMLAMAASTGDETLGARPRDIRRAMNGFAQTLGQLRQAETGLLPRVDASARARLAEALSPSAMDVFDGFLNQMRTVCQHIERQDPGLLLSRSELFRLINGDLGVAVDALARAASEALQDQNLEDRKLAYLDDLTDLPNRRALYRLAERNWRDGGPARPLAVLRLDLDTFKRLNDAYGHAAGDHALVRTAGILRRHLRHDDFVARIGGDEFVLILFGDLDAQTLETRARALIDAVSSPFEFQGIAMSVGLSIGIYRVQAGVRIGLDRVLHNADLALYAAKHGGRGRIEVFTPEMRTRHEVTETLIDEIERGLSEGEFVPYYQPQIEARSGRLVGFEALARWLHPARGVLTPYHFLGVAAEHGLLDALDECLTLSAIAALRTWRDRGLEVPRVSINISSSRLQRPGFGTDLADKVASAGLPVTALGLEILESAMIESNSLQMIETVRGLSQAGFPVELDDFGTGHASIANLRHFKVDRIKIDRSFIKDIHLHGDLSRITASMINLAHSLRIDALGEGVEQPEERLVLNALGIDVIQGYGVAPPMCFDDVEPWVRAVQSPRCLPPRRSA